MRGCGQEVRHERGTSSSRSAAWVGCGSDGPTAHSTSAAPPLLRSGPVDDALVEQIAAVLRVDRSDIIDAEWADNGPGWVVVVLDSADAVIALEPAPTSSARLDIGVVGRIEKARNTRTSQSDLQRRAWRAAGGPRHRQPARRRRSMADLDRSCDRPIRGQPGHPARPNRSSADRPRRRRNGLGRRTDAHRH